MKRLLMVLILFGLTIQSFAQNETEKLSEIEVLGVNYKYLNEVGDSELATPVKILQEEVANYDLKNTDFYEDEPANYRVYFEIPAGKILAVYDDQGEIIRTSERFEDTRIPISVSNTILDKYPGWIISGDIYLITYRRGNGASKTYKLFLEKGDEKIRVKTDAHGTII